MADTEIIEAKSGLKFEVTFKEASKETPKKPVSPSRERPLSQEIIEKKLKEAEERRLALESKKLAELSRYNEKQQIAVQKIAEQNRSFSEETATKQQERLETMSEKKDANIKGLQERLQKHWDRVAEVKKAANAYEEMLQEKLKERIKEKEKNTDAQRKQRQNQIEDLKNRLKDHEKRVAKVMEANQEFSKQTEAKIVSKMETTLKNRENQLSNLLERLREHDMHVKTVRQNKLNQSLQEDGDKESTANES